MFRPDGIVLSTNGRYSGKIEWIEYLGSLTRLHLSWSEKEIIMDIPSATIRENSIVPGALIKFNIDEEKGIIMDL
ncbi:TOBE domain-containing protein [Tissierella creatinini]|nr:TOBE domain-containing protein [Tissierella creatinini]